MQDTVNHQQKFREFMENLALSTEKSKNLEMGIRDQSIYNNWMEARICLIIASEIGNVCKRNIYVLMLVGRLVGYFLLPTDCQKPYLREEQGEEGV